jgi:hypothetical protein
VECSGTCESGGQGEVRERPGAELLVEGHPADTDLYNVLHLYPIVALTSGGGGNRAWLRDPPGAGDVVRQLPGSVSTSGGERW